MIARAMSAQPQPYAVEPFHLARQRGNWRGRIRLSQFQRLAQLLAPVDPAAPTSEADGEEAVVAVQLSFFQDEQRRTHVTGEVHTQVYLSCQRCLQAVPRPIDVQLALCLVRGEDRAQSLDAELEPFVLDGDTVLVADLIEDELILALPELVCQDRNCPSMPAMRYPAGESEAELEQGDNPFAVLKHWRKPDPDGQ